MTNFFKYIKSNTSFEKLTCGELLFAEYKCPIKESTLPIWSEANYLAYVLSGKKRWTANDVTYELKEGEAILVSKGAQHIEQIMEKEFCVLIFFFPDNFLEEVLENFKLPSKPKKERFQKLIPVQVNGPLQIYFQSMAALFSQKQSPSHQLLVNKFRELILQLLNYQEDPDLFHFFELINRPPERKFRQLIDANLLFNLDLEEYAEMAGMSVSTFKRYFKQVYNESPGKFIINGRLSYAASLLKQNNKTIQEVAYESGFENASHFNRMFKKNYKCSPTQYRNSI